ncbi:tryptophan-rich sensory protein [Brevibacterium yomogidense]|uniref:tryptophan-rich sensory protein n=1 Tax=Brevibacterium yomogidense TaxID=946573 RepID=UPI0018DF7DE1|nr:tryptophan-rich sensory protein [Brevibacterium yomogidense]
MRHRTSPWVWPGITAAAVAVSIIGAFIGSGALGGTPIAEAAGGAFSADGTPVAPAGGAFSIWSVIYLGLVGYAIWQLFPAPRRSERQRAVRPWAVASALLNAAWIWTVQLELVFVSVVVIIALLLVLIRILLLMQASPSHGWADTLLTDGTFGLYLGWVTVATIANIAAWISGWIAEPFAGWEFLAVAVVVVAGGIGVGIALATHGRLAPALTLSWGLVWIAVGRASGELESAVIVWAAGIAAVAVLVTAVGVRPRQR